MTIALCLCLLGPAAPTALAQTPSQTGHGETPVIPQSPSGVAGASDTVRTADAPPATVKADADDLPFTGLDIAIVVLVALVLLAAGVGLRRATTSRSEP